MNSKELETKLKDALENLREVRSVGLSDGRADEAVKEAIMEIHVAWGREQEHGDFEGEDPPEPKGDPDFHKQSRRYW